MSINIKESVLDRYSEGAKQREESLCCPVTYDAGLLAMLPDEILEKDYGCGDPSAYVQAGDSVLDLGSGGGKICYMAAQLVGDAGHVIGVDMNDDMLALARKYQGQMATRLGSERVRFVKGHIQDLGLDIDALDTYLKAHPVDGHDAYARLMAWEATQRRENPLIQDQSVDLVISNCVLNLVGDHEKQQLIREIYRVLKPGGRIAISDIVSDRSVPEAMKHDPELWSGCISGAFREDDFLAEVAAAGFNAVCYDKWDTEPWQIVAGIEFRSVTLTAVKPGQGSHDSPEAGVMYRGPFATVTDDTGQCYTRGQRTTVSRAVQQLLLDPAYKNAFIDLSAIDLSAPGKTESGSACCASSEPKTQHSGGCC